MAKPLALAALGVAAVGSFFHYVTKGPHDVPAELEREEDRMEERLEQQMLDKEDAK
ncbi:Formate dehydrogenase N, transmembrane [compost metagenome]